MSNLRRGAPAIVSACVLSLSAAGLSACGNSTSSAAQPASTASKTSSDPSATSNTTSKASNTPASGASSVNVTLSEYKIMPTPSAVRAGRVVFHVTNSGKIKHQFTIIRTDKPAAKVLRHQNPNDDIPGARGEIASLQAAASKTLVIKDLKAGHYALVCALPGHYQSGMYADFTVR